MSSFRYCPEGEFCCSENCPMRHPIKKKQCPCAYEGQGKCHHEDCGICNPKEIMDTEYQKGFKDGVEEMYATWHQTLPLRGNGALKKMLKIEFERGYQIGFNDAKKGTST